MKKKAYAKVNLTLDVLGKRPDGYHDMEMVMVPLELHDLVSMDFADEYSFTSNVNHLPDYERNLIYQAIAEMRKRYAFTEEFKVDVYKYIPTQAGLGGGSSNAAAAILLVDELLNLKLKRQQLEDVAVSVGKDVVFCLYGRSALVEGAGEKLSFIKNNCEIKMLLVKPQRGSSTGQAFSALDKQEIRHYPSSGMVQALLEGDYSKVLQNLGNSFEDSAINALPAIGKIKREMAELGFDASLLCGSGSCVFGLSQDDDLLEKATSYFRKKYPFVFKTKVKRNGHG